jgi:PAS domain S-box-containing protein
MDETHQNGPAQQASSSGDWFQEIAAFLPVGIAKADLRGIVHYANPVIMQMFALTPADIAAGVDIRDILLAEDASEVVQVLGALLAGRAPRPSRYRARDKDGSLFVIEAPPYSRMRSSPSVSPLPFGT